MVDLRQNFKHLHWRPMQHAFGVHVASDWADKSADDPVFGLYKKCGLWTMDEVQILHQCALAFPGNWLDIGCHTGWTTRNIAESGQNLIAAIDPMLAVDEFRARAIENCSDNIDIGWYPLTSDAYFEKHGGWEINGACVDGDHMAPHPERDAVNCAANLRNPGVILFHDAIGKPVQDAVMALHRKGFQIKVYPTPHVVAVCWFGEWTPPAYAPDAFVHACLWAHLGEMAQFL
jgi:hypothetical protein